MKLFKNTFTIILIYLGSVATYVLHLLYFEEKTLSKNDLNDILLKGFLFAVVPIIVMTATIIKDFKVESTE